jgi:hypothetical protein
LDISIGFGFGRVDKVVQIRWLVVLRLEDFSILTEYWAAIWTELGHVADMDAEQSLQQRPTFVRTELEGHIDKVSSLLKDFGSAFTGLEPVTGCLTELGILFIDQRNL